MLPVCKCSIFCAVIFGPRRRYLAVKLIHDAVPHDFFVPARIGVVTMPAERPVHLFVRSSSRERWNSKGGSQTAQEVAAKEVACFVVDLKQMIPLNAQQFVDWDQTRTEQESWPTETMVSLWFKK